MNLITVELFVRPGAKGMTYWCAANYTDKNGARHSITAWGNPAGANDKSARFRLPQKKWDDPLNLSALKQKTQ